MNINLNSILATLESQLAAFDSSSSPVEIFKTLKAYHEAGGKTTAVYDSAGVIPIDADYVGSIVSTADGTLYTLDSAGGSWSNANIPGPEVIIPYIFGGTISGYSAGGSTPTLVNTIQKFSFTTDGNSTDVGDLVYANQEATGQSSSTDGYSSGGYAPAAANYIQKFSFATDGNATDVGDLVAVSTEANGHSSETDGYHSGGYSGPIVRTAIDTFPFASDGNATDAGDMFISTYNASSQTSPTHGYVSAGVSPSSPSPIMNTIHKFPFAVGVTGTDVGDALRADFNTTGQSSETNGYISGGAFPAATNTIQKFSFASDGNATDVGDLINSTNKHAGQSSETFGYTSGGTPVNNNVIQKFPFASDGNATDVGDLLSVLVNATGHQY